MHPRCWLPRRSRWLEHNHNRDPFNFLPVFNIECAKRLKIALEVCIWRRFQRFALGALQIRVKVNSDIDSHSPWYKRSVGSISKCWQNGLMGCRESGDRRSMFLGGRSLQQSDANPTSVEVYVSVSSPLKFQCCRGLPVSFLSVP
jgi:hypothetical protein